MEERDRLRIRGLVPPRQLSLETQCEKILRVVDDTQSDLDKNVYLAGLQDRNETLFFRVLQDNIEKMAPYVYTPTVGAVCQQFGAQFRRTRGVWLSSADRGQMAAAVHNWPHDDVQVVVVTDGSRILGLGDLGANGMGIPIGKLALYTAAGGIDPSRTLPVMLDCGTNNEKLLQDPYYLGMQHKRLQGEEYYSLVHEFIESVYARWPNALVQFEDFQSQHAAGILNAYRNRVLCFNDDIQGTGATTLAGILSALRQVAGPGNEPPALADQRIVVVGAGSAGVGVAHALKEGMRAHGVSEADARNCFWLLDQHGLIGEGHDPAGVLPEARCFAREDAATGASLEEVIAAVKPTVLLGLTGVPGVFSEEAIRTMAKHTERPIVFPLSNPTSRAECTAEQAYTWSEGRAIVASGSPFTSYTYKDTTLHPSQCNNMYIFPGVGLGATLVQARIVSDNMLNAAAFALAGAVSEEEMECGMVFPRVRDIREVSHTVAVAVARSALADGIARATPPSGDLERWVRESMYQPEYQPIVNSVY